MRRLFAVAVALATAWGVAQAAPISGNGFLGDYTGTFTYSSSSSTSGTVAVSLTNTSAPANGGYITGFAFNIPGQPGTVTSVAYTPPGSGPGSGFTVLGGTTFNTSAPVNPYGDADLGAALGGSFLGGGSPTGGIGVGQTGTWTFQLTGTGLDTLTEASFFNALTTGNGSGANRVPFLVRFRGFEDGGSDKVPGGFGPPPINPEGDPEVVVPEPATMLTLGLLGGMGLFAYRFRRKKA